MPLSTRFTTGGREKTGQMQGNRSRRVPFAGLGTIPESGGSVAVGCQSSVVRCKRRPCHQRGVEMLWFLTEIFMNSSGQLTTDHEQRTRSATAESRPFGRVRTGPSGTLFLRLARGQALRQDGSPQKLPHVHFRGIFQWRPSGLGGFSNGPRTTDHRRHPQQRGGGRQFLPLRTGGGGVSFRCLAWVA